MIRKGETLIQDLDTWGEKAGPKSAGQWVDHRSAKEVARCWLGAMSPLLPDEVGATLASHPDFGPCTAWTAEPEARVRFDDIPGEPANVDLLVRGEDGVGPFVVAVEAKADESFGKWVGETLGASLPWVASGTSS